MGGREAEGWTSLLCLVFGTQKDCFPFFALVLQRFLCGTFLLQYHGLKEQKKLFKWQIFSSGGSGSARQGAHLLPYQLLSIPLIRSLLLEFN